MLLGYLALTEITNEKEMFIYFGNQKSVDYPVIKSRFKLHLLPPDIDMITLVWKNFVTGETETEAVFTIEEAFKSGFFESIKAGADLKLPKLSINSLVEKVHKPKKRKKSS